MNSSSAKFLFASAQCGLATGVLALLMIAPALAQQEREQPPSRTVPSQTSAAYARYVSRLKVALQKKTGYAVFQPNNPQLWANVRQTVQDFLFNEWKQGKLQGSKPQQAYFVRCDRTTMTQADIDNGRLICIVGVAPTRPAEFVEIRIAQLMTDHRPKKR
jgi:phage tail sheath protein FI